MSSVINTVAEAAITAVSKMKEGAHNLISGPSSALSPKAESQEDVATGVTTKYGFCGLGKDGMLTSVVQKMSNGDKNVLVKLLIPNDPHQPSSTSSLGGPSLQFVDNLENLFKDSEVIFLALSGESLEEYAKSGLLRSAIVSADGPTKAIVVFGDIDSSIIATIAAELSSFQHIDLLKVTPLSSEKTNATIKQIYCASGSEQVIGKIGDFLNAIGGRPMYVGANLVDAARLIELYAAYESIVAAATETDFFAIARTALFEVCWEAKQLDIDLRNFFRKLPVQRITTVKSAVELADAFVNGDPEKFQFIQKNLDARLATARQTLMLRNRAQPVNVEPQSNGTMPAKDDVDAGEKPTSREKIVENGIADEQKPTTTTNKVDNRRGKSNVTTAESSRSSSRTRRTGATVVNDAARVHIMGAEDDDEDEKAEAVPSLAGANDEQQSNGTADQQNKRGGAGRPKRGAVEEPTKGTRASTRSRTNTADSSNKEQNGPEKRATDRQKKSSDAPQTAEKSTRKAAKGGFSDVAVDPTSTKIAEPSPNNTAEQQQSTNTTQSGGAGEAPDRKFFKSTGGPAATGSGTSTPGKGAFATAFGRLNETKGGTQNTGGDGSPPAKKTEHAALPQPPPNAVDIADLPELDTTPTNTGPSKPQNSIPTGNNKPPGRKAAGTPSAAEKKKNAQIAQSAKRAKSKLGAQTTAGESGSAADAEPTDESQQKTPVKGKKRGNDTTADGGGNETDDTATSSTTKKQATDKKQTKGGKASPTSSTKKGATSTSSGASKKRAAADEDEEETDDDDDEENTSSGDTESEQRFTLDDAKRETDRGAGWKELPEITTPTNIKYTKNDIVWSKITGYPWWPAQIVGLYQVTGKQSPTYEVRVTWLGDNNWSDLKIDQIAPYTEESKAKHAQKKKDKSYQLACMAADLLKSTPNMSVVEATDKAKMQYSTKSPVKGGRAAAAAAATADDPADSAGQKKKTANKKQKTDADASAAATRTRESLRRGAKDKIAEKTGGATTSAEISAENKVDSKKQRDADEAADEKEQQDATDDKTSAATADDSTTKPVTDSAETAAATTTQAEQSNSKADDDSKPTTDKKSGAAAAAVAASDDGEEGTSQLEIDES